MPIASIFLQCGRVNGVADLFEVHSYMLGYPTADGDDGICNGRDTSFSLNVRASLEVFKVLLSKGA